MCEPPFTTKGHCSYPGSGQSSETLLMSKGHSATRVILTWVTGITYGAMVTSRSVLLQGDMGIMNVEIWELFWAGSLSLAPRRLILTIAWYWSRKDGFRPHESWAPHHWPMKVDHDGMGIVELVIPFTWEEQYHKPGSLTIASMT